ncbi:MAG: hypothetical protein Q8R12_03155 [bacterium]|nr:hypothetical protein [bacterium]
MEALNSIFAEIGRGLLNIWWLWTAILLGWLFVSLWLAWRQFLYKESRAYALLEIKIPRESKKSIKAMEHILVNLNVLRNVQGNLREKWWDGEVVEWFSLETVSFGGDIHFYIRTPARHMKVVRSNFYAQYPDVELEEADDYMGRLPDSTQELYQAGYNLWGGELILGKGDGLPIRTYAQFESTEEMENLDPLSGLWEVLSKINKEEIVLVQILARPADPLTWPKKVKDEAAKFREETKAVMKGPLGEEYEIFTRTPGETEKMKQIEAKAFKPAFEFMVRYVYFAPQQIYNVNFAKRGVRSAYFQFSAPNMNYFAPNPRTWTQAWIWDRPHIFPKRILEGRKQRMLYNYRHRSFPAETFLGKLTQFHIFTSSFTQRFSLLNVEELASIFHLPTEPVLTQPLMKRVESRKIGPPPGLPIFREGEGPPELMR